MINHTYLIKTTASGSKQLIIQCDVNNNTILNTFLFADVKPFWKRMKKDFESVLSGHLSKYQVTGNICTAIITPSTTQIYNSLAESEEEYYNTCCEVDTQDLVNLINEWLLKKEEIEHL